MLPNGLKKAFRNHNQSDELQNILDAHKKLVSRTAEYLKMISGEDYGEPKRISANSLVYRQVLLHRSIGLFEGSVKAAVDENPYSMVLNIRGHIETTASLGYLHHRLQSLKQGHISPETLDRNLCDQLLGGHHKSLPQAPDPQNILTQLEHADKSVSTSVLGGTKMQHNILKTCYEFLCEFSHPNFHSNSVAIEPDRSIPGFRFRHGQPMRDFEFKLIGYLSLSAEIFASLYDQIPDLLPA